MGALGKYICLLLIKIVCSFLDVIILTATYMSAINLPYVVHNTAIIKLANIKGNDRHSVVLVFITSDWKKDNSDAIRIQ